MLGCERENGSVPSGPTLGRVLSLALLLLSSEVAAQRPTVALDLSGLDSEAYRRLDAVTLESRSVLRLVQEGFAVVGPDAHPDLIIRLSATPSTLRLESSVAARTVRLGNEPIREVHFEISQKIVELARESLRGRVDAGVPDAGPAVEPSPTIPDAGAALAVARAVKTEASLGGGGLVRGPQIDPRAQLDVRLPLGEHLAINLLIAISTSSGPGLSVLEPELLAGVGYRFFLSERWSLEPRVLAGASLHVYSLDNPAEVDLAGSRGDFLMAFPLTLGWNPIGQLNLGLHVAPGFSTRTREHLRRGTSIWRRDALRFGFGATAGWRF